jgi:glyoxylase-like metal-dependent hydrolase (beta-lactamase superfamily II)
MKSQFFGDIRVDAISEIDRWMVDAALLLPDSTPGAVAEHLNWLGPNLVDSSSGMLVMSMHAYLIRTRHHTILFDTCCGNDKERPGDAPPRPHRMQTAFLENLARAGVLPEQVDYVMCSHLHFDHVGWNTRLRDGQWVPTFPNAKYLISRGEYEFWSDAVKSGFGSTYSRAAFQDSVLPIVRHELAVLVEDNHLLENELPDEIRYVPLVGHTKHHCGLHLSSRAQDAILTGDAIHHPIQLARTDWVQAPCYDKAAAQQTVRTLIDRYVDTSTKVLTAHFPTPTAGYVVSRPEGVRFQFDGE